MEYKTVDELMRIDRSVLTIIAVENMDISGSTQQRRELKNYYDLMSKEELCQRLIERCGVVRYTPPDVVDRREIKRREIVAARPVERYTAPKPHKVINIPYIERLTDDSMSDEIYGLSYVKRAGVICDGIIYVQFDSTDIERYYKRVKRLCSKRGWKGDIHVVDSNMRLLILKDE